MPPKRTSEAESQVQEEAMRTSKKVTRKELDSAFEKALKDISGIRKFSGDLII